ncbi:ATP-binding protein [Rhodohalobacter sp.]|uniref:ATP-binding protein n=1 Tax=Rhodohalobacter sp. TaxID=1974210 RepID=UPI002ACDDB5D|nr:ATP-binding protein [Rhodohalobacter sp.]MDZ7755663.1 ATP-binding protein [Rhodohalobacter sp.]
MNKTATYQITVNASTENLAEVREFVALHAKRQGFTTEQISDLQLAVDEAYTNIIKHAYQNNKDKYVEINLSFDSDKLCISLFDSGNSFSPKNYNLPNIQKKIEERKRGGMGVYLIHQLMDSVSYHANADKNEIRLCKNRN